MFVGVALKMWLNGTMMILLVLIEFVPLSIKNEPLSNRVGTTLHEVILRYHGGNLTIKIYKKVFF